ncbi:ABC transporter ATP-binding protein [Saccharopolyspora endophytica]|uniref:ABC transporter ATP-binding protein n=1 Tax=Saccharopolyspora endophytica TaxID=543886 RepID=A0ABS5DHI3_9PSEU|nr:ABC transporter ATP-binding protein [Saccharopolyspora endophytica]MBQ0925597.1 ABC transporter ATP-binding protein [Saccharopolyspora endophytica]
MNHSPNPAAVEPQAADPPATPLLHVDGLCVDFATEHGWANVVRGVTFSVDEHEIVGIVGESGSGKTVTGLSVLGLVPNPPGRRSGGSIRFAGRELTELPERELRSIRGNEISMIFQEPMTSLNPAFTVGDQIAETVRHHRGAGRKAATARAAEMLDMVGIPNAAQRVHAYPHEFSGGMRQRAMIAMALACEPKMLIADEPTTALDVTIQAQILELLLSLREQVGMAVLLVTHDLGVVAEICDRVVVMYAGQVVESAAAGPLFERPHMPYTEDLLSAMPQLGAREKRLASIPGRTPEPWNLPQGCRFHPRCQYTKPECTADEVALRAVADGRKSRCVRTDELELRGARS